MTMKAWIEGERDGELSDRIVAGAAALQEPGLAGCLHEEAALVELLDEQDGDAFAARYLGELHARDGIDWGDYRPDPARGAAARLVGRGRAILLKLLRPPLDWLVFRQSALNRQFSAQLIEERRARLQMETQLHAELAALREELAARPPRSTTGEA